MIGKPKLTYLNRSKHDTSKGEQESKIGEGVLADRRQGGTDHDGNKSEIGHVLVGTAKDRAVDTDSEDRDGGSEDLVECYRDHGTVQVS